MKKIIFNLFLFLIFLLILLIVTLSTTGIETNKFNKFISGKASLSNDIKLELKTVKFKLDLKKISLFVETKRPKLTYREVYVPIQSVKLYIDFLSLIESELKIKKTNITLDELDIKKLNELSKFIKPSNLKSIINNKVKKGKLISEIDVFFDNQGVIKEFIAKGTVKNFEAELLSGLNLQKTNFSFFADKKDILLKNIYGKLQDIHISDGDIKLDLENGIKLNTNFNSKIDLNRNHFQKYTKLFKKYKIINEIESLKANLNNSISVKLDNTYKVRDYSYNISGKIDKGNIKLSLPIKNDYVTDEIKKINLSNSQIRTSFTPKNVKLSFDGKYSFNKLDFFKINLLNNINNGIKNYKLDFDYGGNFKIGIINYKKSESSISNFKFDIETNNEELRIKNFDYIEEGNSINIKDLIFKKNYYSSFKMVKVVTPNNDFTIKKEKKISIKGNKFDATNLAKFFNKQNGKNSFKKLNNEIEIDFKNIKVPMSEKLKNFKLLGEINDGQFIKISSKGEFDGNNFLDISMKKDKNSDKKYLEIYSDLPRPLLAEYSFFKGLSGGRLLFSSIIEGPKSFSKLKIENFNVVNAPGMIQLLSLADLGGLADLAKGEGLSFDLLEIDMEKNKNFLKINEILDLVPSMSVLMEGYQDENKLTSLRGTLVPAKTLNKMISKIPVIGNIVIPKEIGEGLFGISFKMKGQEGKIKTTINPIRTLTPRFIQKILDRNKKTK